MPQIDPFPADIVELDGVIAIACAKKSSERFECALPRDINPADFSVPKYFYSRDACLVLSFDGAWYPFLDNTQGYNHPPQRW